MTLPASFPFSMSDVATELGLTLPLSINHPWVIALAFKSALPVSFSDLLGQSGHFDGNVTGNGGGGTSSAPFPTGSKFFGGTLSVITDQSGSITLSFLIPPGGVYPNWTGNIKVVNVTAGLSVVLTKSNLSTWVGTGSASLVPPNGTANHLTVYPST
ncbi:hypothetical protein AB1286_33150 [Trinickia sp. NRRL B-1857]|uniref:hypothetical protein n=1 Tax=Trinickia sp. NRRL B-1857 TaxID=3162879 RepID=UPI003D2862FA